jgi:hypothetical protein
LSLTATKNADLVRDAAEETGFRSTPRSSYGIAEAVVAAAISSIWSCTPPPLIQSSAEFTRNFVPPDYLIDGMLQRRFCYSLTAKTGTGKTAIMLRVAAHVALGRSIGSTQVEQGRVLYLAGENPDDLRMRWIGLAQEMGFDDGEIAYISSPALSKSPLCGRASWKR